MKISELIIEGNRVSGTVEVVQAIEDKMREELSSFESVDRDHPPSLAEREFLDKIERVEWTDIEKEKLTGPTNEDEVSVILENEVDLDSSPGEDGIMYRFIAIFWKWQDYRYLYLKFLNFTRNHGSWGLLENCGIMTIKNKKAQTLDHNKKRKLTKLNKDSNLGNGKVWTNRFKEIIIPKVLPRTQFNCQKDLNIINEIQEIRDVNRFLLGQDERTQRNGSILSIDFKDAFRSVSLRWFKLVLEHLGLPVELVNWFWMMYNDLYIYIVINKFKSEKIHVKRGFMEGHPPSMAAFVVSLIPLMLALEEVMTGIVTPDGKRHTIKLFADDLKLFINNLSEVELASNVIRRFEFISGLEMHRDPTRQKCQVLPFGNHRQIINWPEWVTVKNEVKIVGAIFSNEGNLEKINTALVSKTFFDLLHKSYGIKGTVFQKVNFVNTYLFSKIWFTAQCFKLDQKVLEKMLAKAMAFIYSGENESQI